MTNEFSSRRERRLNGGPDSGGIIWEMRAGKIIIPRRREGEGGSVLFIIIV